MHGYGILVITLVHIKGFAQACKTCRIEILLFDKYTESVCGDSSDQILRSRDLGQFNGYLFQKFISLFRSEYVINGLESADIGYYGNILRIASFGQLLISKSVKCRCIVKSRKRIMACEESFFFEFYFLIRPVINLDIEPAVFMSDVVNVGYLDLVDDINSCFLLSDSANESV